MEINKVVFYKVSQTNTLTNTYDNDNLGDDNIFFSVRFV